MKKRIQFFGLMLALVLCLFGCTTTETEASDALTDATISAVTAQKWYADAVETLRKADALTLTYSYRQERTVGTDTFTTDLEGTSGYNDIHSEKAMAVVKQSISYGTYGVQYGEVFRDGTAYIFANACDFAGACDWETFCDRQLPAVVLDAALYSSLQPEETEEGITLTFSGATGTEKWECVNEEAVLVSATGTAVLDNEHTLNSYTYSVTYTLGAATYRTSLTMSISRSAQLEIPENWYDPANAVDLEYLDAPKLLLRSVGDIFTAQSFTSEANQQVSSAALDLMRIDQNSFSLSGSGKQMVAAATYQVTLSDYRGATTTTSQSERFADGIFTRVSNGSTPVETTETAENIRIRWENSILNGLFALTYLDGAVLTETDDFYILNFTGNEAYCSAVSSSLNAIFSSDLDSLATSYTDTLATGYLTINKQTGLPTALGMAFSRTHVLYDVSYQLTYQLDQKLCLASEEYEDTAADIPVEDPPTPLFYQVTGENGQQLWLLGTIHVGDERTDELPQQIYDALRNADALAVEYDINAFLEQMTNDPATQSAIAASYYYQDGTMASDHLSAESYEQALIQLTASGSYTASLPYMRPVFLANLLESFYLEQGYQLSTDNGVDARLLSLASILGKKVISIESGLSQLQLLASFSDGLQQLLLDTTLENGLVGYNRNISTLYELWCEGDAQQLYPLLFADDENAPEEERVYWQEYDQKLITDRNSTMLKAAIDCLESGETVFYAVGLAHLLGENGLVAQLEAAGYTVRQVTYNE